MGVQVGTVTEALDTRNLITRVTIRIDDVVGGPPRNDTVALSVGEILEAITTRTSIAFPFTPIDVVSLYRGGVFNETINVTDIIPPSGRLFAPGIVSPISLISFGMLFALFLYLSTRIRWTQSLFIVSILLSVMSFVVFMEPALFVMGILLSLVSLVLDKYL